VKFNKKKGVLIFLLILLLAILVYNYIYQEHRNISTELPVTTITADKLFLNFKKDFSGSENEYLDKTIIINGSVSELNTYDLTLDNMVFCNFKDRIPSTIKINSNIEIKGRMLGYDELLEIIKIDQSIITK